MGNIILACLLILFFILCYFVVLRAQRFFDELLRNAAASPAEDAGLKDLP